MLEKELKILNIHIPHLEDILQTHGAILTYDGPIFDITFKQPAKHALKIRLRKTRGGAKLCFKRKPKRYLNSDVKIRQEREYEVDRLTTLHDLQQQTTLIAHKTKSKWRKSYKLGSLQFDIDQYPSLPPLLEIEAPTIQDIHAWTKKLGYEKHQQLNCGVKGLFTHYGYEKLTHYA